MAIGKNKRLSKGKKGSKKKIVDPFARKEWYVVRAPGMFTNTKCGQTLVTRTTGLKVASEMLKGRVCELNMADLTKDAEQGYRKVKLEIQDVHGRDCLTDFYGMELTRDKMCSLVRKWQSTIEAHIDCPTADGYIVRLFTIAFTQRAPGMQRAHCYANGAQRKEIRGRMVDLLKKDIATLSFEQFVKKLVSEEWGKEMEKACRGVYPLKDVHVYKVKTVRRPRFQLDRLLELHSEVNDSAPMEFGKL